MNRTLLCRSASIATRQRVFRVQDGLEVDEIDHFEVRRWRVLYEDVILVTYHQYRGAMFLVFTASFAFLFAMASIAAGSSDAKVGWWMAAFLVTPFVFAFFLRLSLGVDEINVYSRRSQAKLRFGFRKRLARELFEEITRTVRHRQDLAARKAAPPVPQPAPNPGMA